MITSKPSLRSGFDWIIRTAPSGAGWTKPSQPGHYPLTKVRLILETWRYIYIKKIALHISWSSLQGITLKLISISSAGNWKSHKFVFLSTFRFFTVDDILNCTTTLPFCLLFLKWSMIQSGYKFCNTQHWFLMYQLKPHNRHYKSRSALHR